jgi:hypothetical protein
MEENNNNEISYVRIECIQSEFGKLFNVYVSYYGKPRQELPFQFSWPTNSLDLLRSLLTQCTEFTKCTVDGVIQWLTNNDSPLLLIADKTSEEEFENRLKQWQDSNPTYKDIGIRIEA